MNVHYMMWFGGEPLRTQNKRMYYETVGYFQCVVNDIGEITKCWKNKVKCLPIPKVSECTTPGSTVDVIFHMTLTATTWTCDMRRLWIYHVYVLKAKCKSLTMMYFYLVILKRNTLKSQTNLISWLGQIFVQKKRAGSITKERRHHYIFFKFKLYKSTSTDK